MKITRRQLKNFLNEAMRQTTDAEREREASTQASAQAREATGSSAVRYEVLLFLITFAASLRPFAICLCLSYMFLAPARVVINAAYNAGKFAVVETLEYLWESNSRDWSAQLINEGYITAEQFEQMQNEHA